MNDRAFVGLARQAAEIITRRAALLPLSAIALASAGTICLLEAAREIFGAG